MEKLNFQAMIKLTASAASLDLQGSPPSPAIRMPAAPSSALAADLITA